MYIAYFDESGDDGNPGSSKIFVLTTFYLHHQEWKNAYQIITDFRQQLKSDFGFPVKFELHTKALILDKHPYKYIGWAEEERIQIVELFAKMIAALRGKFINVAILKEKIIMPTYPVLENAVKYSVQRIENDLLGSDPTNRFLSISDHGRIGKMRKTTRKIQKINYIPSKYNPGSYRKEIQSLIEDPLQKESHESYFIQLADLVGYLVYNYSMLKVDNKLHNRMPSLMDGKKIKELLNIVKGVLNLKAAEDNEFGIVMYPK